MKGCEWCFSTEEPPLSLSWLGQAGRGPKEGGRSVGWSRCLALSLPPCCPSQVHGSRLRLPHVTPADSGEYVCRVVSGSGTQEASVLITIQQRHGPHSACLRNNSKWWGTARATSPSMAPAPCLPSHPPSPGRGVPCPHRVLLSLPGQWTYSGSQLLSGQPNPPHHHLV